MKTDRSNVHEFSRERHPAGKDRTMGSDRSATAVDGWFDAQLTELYGEIADEPIPQDLLELVDKLNLSK